MVLAVNRPVQLGIKYVLLAAPGYRSQHGVEAGKVRGPKSGCRIAHLCVIGYAVRAINAGCQRTDLRAAGARRAGAPWTPRSGAGGQRKEYVGIARHCGSREVAVIPVISYIQK